MSIKIDYSKKDQEANTAYQKVCFLSSVLLDEIDNLKETTNPMHQMKFHLNGIEREINKEGKKFFNKVCEAAGFTNEDGIEHKGEDIYFNTLNAYRSIFSRSIQDIIGIAELLKHADEKGIDYSQIEVGYEPLKS